MRRLRIAVVADVEPDPDSGAAGTEMSLADELEKLGHEVVRVWRDQIRHRIVHWNLHHLFEQPREYRRVIRDLLSKQDIDVLHVNQPAGWLAARELRHVGWRGLFVHRTHGFEPRIAETARKWSRVFPAPKRSPLRRLASRLLRPLQARSYRAIVRWAEAHVVSCRECAEDLVRRGAEPKGVLVCPQAPGEEFVEEPPPDVTPRRLRRVLYVGQFAYIKAPMVVAQVLRSVLEDAPDLEATWVCEEAAHGKIRELLGRDAAVRVRLLGWTSRRELRDVFDQHGVFLFPSFTEGFGKVFLEAMARGLCVVATEQGGARDWIIDGKNGRLAPVGDMVALAKGIQELLRDEEFAVRLSHEARNTAERVTWRGAAEQLAGFYEARLEDRWRTDRVGA